MTAWQNASRLYHHLISRLRDLGHTVLLAIASEEVFLDRMEHDRRLSQSGKGLDRWNHRAPHHPRRAA